LDRNSVPSHLVAVTLLLLVFAGSGCSLLSLGRYDTPVGGSIAPRPLSRSHPFPFVTADAGSILVGVSCSGGGSRAAYLTAAILREIRRSGLRIDLGEHSPEQGDLLDQIDFVSRGKTTSTRPLPTIDSDNGIGSAS